MAKRKTVPKDGGADQAPLPEDVQEVIADASLATKPEPIAATPKAWRQANLHEVAFSDGKIATLKRVHLMDLVAAGKIPQALTAQVSELVDTFQQGDQKTIKFEELKQFVNILNILAIACFVEPKVAEAASDSALGVDEVPFEDKVAVFQWAMEATSKVSSFRGKSANGRLSTI